VSAVRRHVMLFFLVISHHLMADEITRRFGRKGTTAVRTDGKTQGKVKIVLRFYSMYQFLALASHLTPRANMPGLGFNTIIAIQSSACLMTLYRKSIVASHTHGLVYSTCLLLSSLYILKLNFTREFLLGVTMVYVLRVFFRVNKYVLWALFAVVTSPAVIAYVSQHSVVTGLVSLSPFTFQLPVIFDKQW
jgi:hypothetical protein